MKYSATNLKITLKPYLKQDEYMGIINTSIRYTLDQALQDLIKSPRNPVQPLKFLGCAGFYLQKH